MHSQWARIWHDKRAFQQHSISFLFLSFSFSLFLAFYILCLCEYKLILRNCNKIMAVFLCLKSKMHTFCRTSLAILHVAINRPNQRPNMGSDTLTARCSQFDHDFSVCVCVFMFSYLRIRIAHGNTLKRRAE